MKLSHDLAKYLKEIFGESQRVVFTVFDVVGIVLFFFPHLAQGLVDDETLARNIGGAIFFVSFLLANFNLYRKLSSEVPSTNVLNEDSLLMYPYANPPSNSIELRYVGQEIIKDLNVKMIYKDKAGIDKEQEIFQFFPENDRKMGLHSSREYVLVPNQITRFYLLGKEATFDRKVKVVAEFTGAKSGRHIVTTREFNLSDKPSVQIF